MTSNSPESTRTFHRLLSFITSSLEDVRPDNLVRSTLRLTGERLTVGGDQIFLEEFGSVHLLAAGKASWLMSRGLLSLLQTRVGGGVIITNDPPADRLGVLDVYPGGHPIPDAGSTRATEAMLNYIDRKVERSDLVFFLLSGGASAMLCAPPPGISLDDLGALHRQLIECGADIIRINRVRAAVSRVKGGRLLRLIQPARCLTLVLSDIIGSPLPAIGSGPTVPVSTGAREALAVLRQYGLMETVPRVILDYLEKQVEDESTRGSKTGKAHGSRAYLIGDNRILLDRIKTRTEKEGLPAMVMTAEDRGEASEAARRYASLIRRVVIDHQPAGPPLLMLGGGELTVTVRGSGRGGRNQEFLLHLLQELRDFQHPFIAVSMGSDGIDGPTDAAGAWIDENTLESARRRGLSVTGALRANDSYTFFNALGRLIKTGPTGTNLMDLRLFYLP